MLVIGGRECSNLENCDVGEESERKWQKAGENSKDASTRKENKNKRPKQRVTKEGESWTE